MFLVKTRLGPSPIHGVGVFAGEDVAQGAIVWRFAPAFDRIVTDDEARAAPAAFADHLRRYAYPSQELQGRLILSCDDARYLNHSDDPNTVEEPGRSVAARAIAAGEEITCDYGAFCAGWTGLDR